MISAKLLIVVETEIWPNLYNSCEKNNTKILIINARFNPPKGILRILSKKIYEQTLNVVDHVYCKSKKDEDGYVKYISPNKVSNLGNIKYSLIKDTNLKDNRIYIISRGAVNSGSWFIKSQITACYGSKCAIKLPSMFIVLSKRIGEPVAGLILTAPEDVLMVTAASP